MRAEWGELQLLAPLLFYGDGFNSGFDKNGGQKCDFSFFSLVQAGSCGYRRSARENLVRLRHAIHFVGNIAKLVHLSASLEKQLRRERRGEGV